MDFKIYRFGNISRVLKISKLIKATEANTKTVKQAYGDEKNIMIL